jgi:hypothetical protein
VLNFAWLPIIYFFYIETAGLSLEEVDLMFKIKYNATQKMSYKEAAKIAKVEADAVRRAEENEKRDNTSDEKRDIHEVESVDTPKTY